MLDAVRDEWARIGLAIGRADRPRAEAGVRLAYQTAGIAPPARMVWLDSPLQGMLAAALLAGPAPDTPRNASLEAVRAGLEAQGVLADGGAGRCVRAEVRTALWAGARAELAACAGHQAVGHLWEGVGIHTWHQRIAQMVRLVRAGATGAVGEQLGPRWAARVWRQSLDAELGQHDAGWLGFLDAANRALAHAGPWRLAGHLQAAAAAGWWWSFERVAVLTERAAVLHLDELERLHRADGPAMAYPDGFAVHAWHGMPIPAELAVTLRQLTVARIQAEENAELRRVMLEHYGLERYLRDADARRIHRDAAGTLWRCELPGDEPLVMVEVINATPEPDGRHRTYWLRVPPWLRTAREAVAWTFDIPPDQYRPQRQT